MPKFKTTLIQADGMNATGILAPAAVIEALGQGKRPKVTVAINGYIYRTTVAVMGGKYMIGLAKEHRDKAGVQAGERIDVTLERDTAPREVDMPKDFAAALKKAGLARAFAALAFTHRKEHVRAIAEAKAPETRLRRIEKAIAMVRARKA